MRDFRNPREQKALTRARRVKVRVAGLVALLGLSGAGLVYREAIAQELMATGSTVLTVEQEKAKAAKPGSDFKECANGCPVMIVVPAGKFIMGSPETESGREASEGPQHEVTTESSSQKRADAASKCLINQRIVCRSGRLN